MNKIKYLCKIFLNEKKYVKFSLNDTISDSLYDLVKWAKKFGAVKVQLIILENCKTKEQKNVK